MANGQVAFIAADGGYRISDIMSKGVADIATKKRLMSFIAPRGVLGNRDFSNFGAFRPGRNISAHSDPSSSGRPWLILESRKDDPMTNTAETAEHELVLTRLIDAPREKLFRAWTEAELLKKWFSPAPWTTPHAEMDLRPGGGSLIVMRSPEGQDMPNPGIVLEVVKNEKLVFTDAYTAGWVPSAKPLMTAIITFEDEDGKTRYRHAPPLTAEDRGHENGFHEGAGICADQLAALAAKI